MELLKPTFSGHHPLNSEISRSTIIQKLSMLVGFLSWISPDAPNADMCMHCKTVIQHVLDHALNTVPTSNETYAVLDQFDATQLLFNYDLMDTFDWLRPDDMMNQSM
jgi:hypothetical protein